MTGVLFRSNGEGRLAAVVRTDDGAFDLNRTADSVWHCSCSRAAPCPHAVSLPLALVRATESTP